MRRAQEEPLYPACSRSLHLRNSSDLLVILDGGVASSALIKCRVQEALVSDRVASKVGEEYFV